MAAPGVHGRAHPSRRNFATWPFERASPSIREHRAALFARARFTCFCVQRVRSRRCGSFRCGADKRSHLHRTLWTWQMIAAIVRVLAPGSWAFHARASRCSSTSWFMQSFTRKAFCMPSDKSLGFTVVGIFPRQNEASSERLREQAILGFRDFASLDIDSTGLDPNSDSRGWRCLNDSTNLVDACPIQARFWLSG